MRSRSYILAVIGIILVSYAPYLSAYGNIKTHPLITARAIRLLQDTSDSKYDELVDSSYSDAMQNGSKNEDVPSTRGAIHFYNPRTGLGLKMRLDKDGAVSQQYQPAIQTAQPIWAEAIQAYKNGNKSDAYELLGHVVHLVTQDMAQPAHVHNDPHLPHDLSAFSQLFNLHGDDSPYENFVEDLANTESQLNTFNSFVGTTVKNANSPNQFANAVATATYNLALCSQIAISSDSFTLKCGSFIYAVSIKNGDPLNGNPSCQVPHWQANGKTRILCSDDTTIEDGGFLDNFSNDFWKIPEIPANNFLSIMYFDRTDEVEVDNAGTTQNQFFFSQAIPLSIEYTAGLIKLFAKTVDSFSPQITLKNSDGYIFPAGDTIYGTHIIVDVTDPANSTFPTASGVHRILLDGPVHQSASFTGLPDEHTGFDEQSHDFQSLLQGSYTVTAIDGLGNSTTAQFTISLDTSPPSIAVSDIGSNPVHNGDLLSVPYVVVTSSDAGSGVGWIELTDQANTNSTPLSQQPVGGVAPTFSATFSNLRVVNDFGSYCATSFDAMDNASPDVCFNICTNLDGCQQSCSIDPNSAACQQACNARVPGACQAACVKNPSSSVCQNFCFNNPLDPVCQADCAHDQTLPYCNPSCQNQPLSPACQQYCQTHASDPICQQSCAQNAAYCPPGGGPPGGGGPTVNPPSSGGSGGLPGTIGGCDPPITFIFNFCGPQNSCYTVLGGDDGCLLQPGSTCTTFQFTATHIGLNTFTVVVTDGQTGTSTVEHEAVFVHGCAPDPTFLGGNPFPFTLPDPLPQLADAFSPAVPGSPKQIYQKNYQVFGSQAEVFILVRDSSGTLVRNVASELVASAGVNSFTWDGKNDGGISLPEGSYTYTVAQRSLTDASQFSAFSGLVAIENTAPTATFTGIQVSSTDPTALEFMGTISDPYLKSYQLECSTSASGPWTLMALASQAPKNGRLTMASRSLFPDGTNFARVTAINLAGLQTVLTQSFTINRSTAGLAGVPVQIGASSQTVLNPGGSNPPADNPTVFVEDTLPTQNLFNWTWVNSPVYSGQVSHTDNFADGQLGTRLHYFAQANPGRTIGIGENIIQYAFIDPAHPPQEILLGFYTGQGDGEHRVYWGDNLIQTGGTVGTSSLLSMGGLPPAGGWIRLKIPAALLNLEGKTIKGIVFGAYAGRAIWDKTTTSLNNQDSQVSAAAPIATPSGFDSVSTSLTYRLPRAANLRLDVFDYASGALVKTLINMSLASGTYTTSWDQTDNANSPAPDGNYFFRFSSVDGPIDSEALLLSGTTTVSASFQSTIMDADHNNYQLDLAHLQVTKTNSEGFLLTKLPIGNLSGPSGLALDPAGNLLVQTSSGTVRFDIGRVDFGARTLSADIRIPWDNALVRATVPIIGGVSGRHFASYTVDVGPTWNPSTFTFLNQGFSQVIDNFVFPGGAATVYGNLATWETGLVGGEEYPAQDLFHPPEDRGFHGRWTIRLRANDTDGGESVSERKVVIGRVLNNATGGVIVSEDSKARIRVPPLALQEDWSLFGFILASTTAPSYMPPPPAGLAPIGSMYELMPAGYQFKQPVSFQIAQATAALTVGGAAIPANRVGLYVYNTDSGQWDRVPTLPSVMTDTTTGITANLFTAPSLTAIPDFDGFYALYADTSAPSIPVLNPLPASTTHRSLFVSGFAEPLSTVNLYFISGGASTQTVQETLSSNLQGLFAGNLVFPSTGTFSIAARTIDAYGNPGSLSASQVVQVLSAVPSTISSLTFRDLNFSTTPIVGLQKNAPIYLEMQAADIVSGEPDTVYVVLSSSATDSAGIVVALTQIDNTSPVYRGSAYLGDVTDPAFVMLAATHQGESITAVAQANAAVSAALPLTDFTAPSAPKIFSPTHPASFQDTFEEGTSEWATFNSGSGAAATLDSSSSSTGQNSIQVQQQLPNGDFSAWISNRPFNVRQTPIVSFDYLFPPSSAAPRFSFYFRRNGVLHQVEATETDENSKTLSPTFTPIGSILSQFSGFNITCGRICASHIPGDGQWHHMEFNLLQMFKNVYPGDTDFTVDQVFLADFDQTQFYGMVPGNTPVGSTVHFDNFMIRSAGASNANPFFTWIPPAGSIAGYSYGVDQSSDTLPPAQSSGTGTAVSFSGLAPGVWYFHLRAENAQGFWGPANHYVFRVDQTPPVLSNPSPAPALPLLRTEQTTAILNIADESVVDPDSLVFSVNGSPYHYGSGGISYDVASGSLTIALTALHPVPIIHDGDIVTVSIDDLADLAGNHIPQPFSWSWQADFSASIGGGFGPVTFNGGKDAAWSADSQRLAFSSNRFGSDDLFVVSSQDSNVIFESSATLMRLTSSPANEYQPTWSPDGVRLAFVSDQTGHPQIWVMAADGSGTPVQLSLGAANDTHPSWSADGSEIYFSRASSGVGDLWAIDIDTHSWLKTGEHQVTKTDIGFDLDPVISRDGTRITYRRSLYVDNVYTVGTNGVSPAALTNTGTDITPSFSPSGQQIVFSSKRTSQASELWLMNADGTGAKRLLDNLNTWPETQPTWSPDGGRIAFTTTRSGASNIWLLSVMQVSNFAASPTPFSPGGISPTAKKTITFSYQLSASNAVASLDVVNDRGNVVAAFFSNQAQTSGLHTINWNGRDAANAVVPDGSYTARLTVTGPAALDPIIRQAPFQVDSTPPSVTLTATTGGFGPSQFYNPGTNFSLSATDNISVVEADLAIDTTTQFALSTGTFALAAGTHTVAYRALDTAGNLGVPVVQPLFIDDQSPISSVTFHGPYFVAASSEVFVTAGTTFSITAVDSSSSSIVSGVHLVNASMDGGGLVNDPSRVDLKAFGFAEGLHNIAYFAEDNAGNLEGIHNVPVFVDITSPTVTVTANPPLFYNGVRYFGSTATLIGFTAQDPISGGDASGLFAISASTDGAAYQLNPAPFTGESLGVGAHILRYFAQDNVGNNSALQAINLSIDNHPPSAVINVSNPNYVAGTMLTGTTHYASFQSQFSFSVASGAAPADFFNVNVDGGGLQVFSSTQTLSFSAEGLHTIQFAAVRGGVSEGSEIYSVVIDSTPPTTVLSFGAGRFEPYLRPDTMITLTSTDTASGVANIQYVLDGSTFAYSQPFTLSAQHGLTSGSHAFMWYAADHLGSVEASHSATLILDNTPPGTSVQFVGGHQFNDGVLRFASGDTSFDIVATGGGSGVGQIFVDSGTGAGFQTFSGTFTYAGQGLRQIHSYAVDNVGNIGPDNFFQIYTDTAGPPVSSSPTISTVMVGSATYARLATGFAVTTGLDNLSGLGTVTILTDGISSGSPAQFTSEGLHTLEIFATDRVGNQSSPHLQLNVVIDETPPTSQIMISSSTLIAGTTAFITSTTPVVVSAIDYYAGNQTPGVGVRESHLTVDGGTDLIVSGTFTVTAAGLHRLDFYSIDRLDNREATKTQWVAVDTTTPTGAPFVTLSASGTFVTIGTTTFAAPGNHYQFSAEPPGAPIQWSLDGGAFGPYNGSAITLAEAGLHTLTFFAVSGSTQVYQVTVDTTPPVSFLSIGTMTYSGGEIIPVSSATLISLHAVDAQAGVAASFFQFDAGAIQTFTTNPLPAIGSGTHQLAIWSLDALGNQEPHKTFTLVTASGPVTDTVPPTTQISFSTAPFVNGVPYFSSGTLLSFTAEDSGASASGVAFTHYAVDAGTFTPFALPFTLAEGLHTLRYQSQDNAGNLEAVHVSTAAIDASAPVTSLLISSGAFISTMTVFSLQAIDPLSGGVASGVKDTWLARDGGAFAVSISSFVFTSTGTHALQWFSVDQVGNGEVLRSTSVIVLPFKVIIDTIPPVTQIVYTPAAYVDDAARTYISTTTSVGLAATDASAVAFTKFRIDPPNNSAPYQIYASTFALAEGAHTIDYFSQDVSSNVETSHRVKVLADGTPPIVTFKTGNPSLGTPDVLYVSSKTAFSFSVKDPSSHGVASGGKSLLYSVDGSSQTVYAGPFMLSGEGAHCLSWFARDLAGNQTVVSSRAVIVDSNAPMTTLAYSIAPFIDPTGRLFITTTTAVSLSAEDAVSGVASTEFSVNGSAYQTYVSSFTLPEGASTVEYFSQDKVGRIEKTQHLALRADGTPPVSKLTVGAPKATLPSGVILVGPASPLSIDATDPSINGVRSLVKESWVAVDSAAFTGASSAFTLASAGDGDHTIRFFSRDNVLNSETVESASLRLDATLPAAQLADQSFPQGLDPVMGTASDANLKKWVLDYAPGQQATLGYKTIKTGPSSVLSGTLATWNTRQLSGDFTLRLTVTDLVGQESITQKNVHIAAAGAVLGGLLPVEPAPDPQWGAVFVFPNPAQHGAIPTIHIEAGDVNRITVRIYNIAGQKLLEDVITQAPILVDSGNGLQYAYEYPWTGHIASGVYFFTLDAENAGQHKTKKGKFAVVR